MAFVTATTRCYLTAFRRVRYVPVRTFSNNQYIEGIPRIAGRANLPGSEGEGMPKTLSPPKENFPYVLDVTNPEHGFNKAKFSDVSIWGRDLELKLNSLLGKYGAILIQGLPINCGADFGTLVDSFRATLMQYLGGVALRTNVNKGVYTASNEPRSVSIELHNEMSYSNENPKQIMFYCEKPAVQGRGGESVIADVRDVYRNLDKNLIGKLEDVGVRYHSYLPTKENTSYMCWQDVYCTEKREDVESFLKEAGRSFKWVNNDLAVWYTLPVMKKHNMTGEQIWFNQVTALHASYTRTIPQFKELYQDIPDDRLPYHTFYGDGSTIEPHVIQHIRNVSWSSGIGFQMKKNEVLALDNMYVQHSRLSFEGERRLLTSLLQW